MNNPIFFLLAGAGLIWTGFCLFKMGKIQSQNEQIKKENSRQRKRLEVASLPAPSWDELVEWMRNGGKPLPTIP